MRLKWKIASLYRCYRLVNRPWYFGPHLLKKAFNGCFNKCAHCIATCKIVQRMAKLVSETCGCHSKTAKQENCKTVNAKREKSKRVEAKHAKQRLNQCTNSQPIQMHWLTQTASSTTASKGQIKCTIVFLLTSPTLFILYTVFISTSPTLAVLYCLASAFLYYLV